MPTPDCIQTAIKLQFRNIISEEDNSCFHSDLLKTLLGTAFTKESAHVTRTVTMSNVVVASHNHND